EDPEAVRRRQATLPRPRTERPRRRGETDVRQPRRLRQRQHVHGPLRLRHRREAPRRPARQARRPTWLRTLRARRAPHGRLRDGPRRLDETQGQTVDRQGPHPRRRVAPKAGEEAHREEERREVREQARMTVDVQTEIVIDRSVETVAIYA